MATHETHDTSDPIGHAEYRVDAGFLIGYLILYLGLLVFHWDPHYVILGVSVELVLVIIGALVKAYLLSNDRAAQAVATVLCLPALLLAIGLCSVPLAGILDDQAGGNPAAYAGLVAFFLSAVYSRWQRFRRTTLRLARFMRYFDETYVHEDGRRVIGPFSQIMSAVLECWLATIVFTASWFIAVVAGGIKTGDGDMTRAGVILLTLCLLRELVGIGLVRLAYRNRPDPEAYWLEAYSRAGKVVRRQPE